MVHKLASRHGSLLRGLYNGLPAVVVREVPNYALYFVLYDTFTRRALRRARKRDPDASLSPLAKFTCGGLAGAGMWLVGYPLDYVKTRVQAKVARPRLPANSIFCTRAPLRPRVTDHIARTFAAGGLVRFYRGLTPAVLRAFPTHAVTFLLFEAVLSAADWFVQED